MAAELKWPKLYQRKQLVALHSTEAMAPCTYFDTKQK